MVLKGCFCVVLGQALSPVPPCSLVREGPKRGDKAPDIATGLLLTFFILILKKREGRMFSSPAREGFFLSNLHFTTYGAKGGRIWRRGQGL